MAYYIITAYYIIFLLNLKIMDSFHFYCNSLVFQMRTTGLRVDLLDSSLRIRKLKYMNILPLVENV